MALSKLTLTAGLVNIPVRIEGVVGTGTKPSGNHVCAESAHLLSARGGVAGVKSCGIPHEGECRQVVGYEMPDGSFFVPAEGDLYAIQAEKDGAIALETFVPAHEIDPVYFDKTYTLKIDPKAPKTAADAFALLVTTLLKEKGLIAVARAVLDKDERLVFIRYSKAEDCVFFVTGCFDEQIDRARIQAARASLPEVLDFSKSEKALALQLSKVYATPFEPASFVPERWHKLGNLIAQAQAAAVSAVDGAAKLAPSQDVQTLLKASIKQKRPAQPKRRPKTAA